jgi:thiamine-phosphate pyrophosphorylase
MELKKLYRILDANFNRAREGMRVLEEVIRFGAGSVRLQRSLKSSRHALSDVLKNYAVNPRTLLKSRDVRRDVGKRSSRLEETRIDLADIFIANIQRVKESLRALEEFSKLTDRPASRRIKEIRFRLYELEKKAIFELEALRDNLPGTSKRAGSVHARRVGNPRRRRRTPAP